MAGNARALVHNVGLSIASSCTYTLTSILFQGMSAVAFADSKGSPYPYTQHVLYTAAMSLSWTAASLASYPLDTVRRRLMMQVGRTGSDSDKLPLYEGPIDCIDQIVRAEGFGGLWAGAQTGILLNLQLWCFVLLPFGIDATYLGGLGTTWP